MKITTTGRKVNLKPAFIERAEKRLSRLDKFFSDEAAAQVTVTVEKDWQTVELTVRDRGFIARAEKSADTMEDALDAAVELLTKQIVKNRKRLETKLYKAAFDEYADLPQEEDAFSVVREKEFFVKPVSVEEAILQMNLLGHSFYLFRNEESDELNLVYRRKNGDYGLLIPRV